MPDLSIQKRLLDMVHQQIPDKLSFVFELSELLGISNDSVYRRLREETPLDIFEIEKICQHYKISFDSILNSKIAGSSVFHFSPINTIDDFINYLSYLKDILVKAFDCPQSHIYYAAIDIPILHNFRFPMVAMFKSIYWLKSISNEPNYNTIKFSKLYTNQQILKLMEEMHQLYSKIPSTEIWTDQILNSILRQVDYYWDSGEFVTKDDAIALLEEVEEEFKYLETAVCQCSKILTESNANTNYYVYLSDIQINNNCILLENKFNSTAFLSTHTYNVLSTTNPIFVAETKHWINSFLKKSVLISGVGERQRFSFFHQAYDKIESIKKKITSSVINHF